MVAEDNQTKRCPFCAEEIKMAAIVCKHCGREIPSSEQAQNVQSSYGNLQTPRPNPMRAITIGLIAGLLLLVGGYFVFTTFQGPVSGSGAPSTGTDVQGETNASDSLGASSYPLQGNASDVTWACRADDADATAALCWVQFTLTNASNVPVTVADKPFVTVNGNIFGVSPRSPNQNWAQTLNPGASGRSGYWFSLPIGGNVQQVSIANEANPAAPDGVVPFNVVVKITE